MVTIPTRRPWKDIADEFFATRTLPSVGHVFGLLQRFEAPETHSGKHMPYKNPMNQYPCLLFDVFDLEAPQGRFSFAAGTRRFMLGRFLAVRD